MPSGIEDTRIDDIGKRKLVAMASSESGFKSKKEPLATYEYKITQTKVKTKKSS